MNKEETKKILAGVIKEVEKVRDQLFDAPKPEPETAFQVIARQYFHAMWPHDDYLTRDWNSILNPTINKKRLERLKPVFNATLDLAREATYENHYREEIQAAIEALKEPKS